MTAQQIREVVKITLDELQSRQQYRPVNYNAVLKNLDAKLYDYFDKKDNSVEAALKQVLDDEYIDVLYLQYRDHKTIEWIAEYFDKDTSTIRRNKKRLIMKIYELMEEAD